MTGQTPPVDRAAAKAGTTDDIMRRHLGYRMKLAYLAIEATVAGVLRDHELSLTAFSALGIVIENPRLIQTELAQALQIERSSTVLVVDTLENRDLITRNRVKGDRRTYALLATVKGRRLFDRIAAEIDKREGALQVGLHDADRAALLAALECIESAGKAGGAGQAGTGRSRAEPGRGK